MFGNNYTQIREEGGKRYLFDINACDGLSSILSKHAERLKEARVILEKYDYPTSEGWQRAIIESGKAGLEKVVIADNDKQAARLKIPRYVASQWRKQALSDIPRAMLDEVEGLFQNIDHDQRELPINDGDLTFDKNGNPELKTDDIRKRIVKAASLEITPEMQAEVDKVKEIMPQLRELNEAGVNIQSIVAAYLGNRYAPSQYPALDDLSLLVRILNTRQLTAKRLLETNPDGYYRAGGEKIETDTLNNKTNEQ